MKLKVLSSGSVGNCYLLETDTETLVLDCGKHYINGRYDARKNPYCCDCRRKHEREKQRILKEKKQYQAKKIVWDSAVKKTAETIKSMYCFTV